MELDFFDAVALILIKHTRIYPDSVHYNGQDCTCGYIGPLGKSFVYEHLIPMIKDAYNASEQTI